MNHFEQVPQHSVTQLDDGVQERLQIVVRLPGIVSVSEFTVRVQTGSLKLHAPGRYYLDLALDAVVEDKPEQLKFVKKRNEFKAVLRVIDHPVVRQPQHPSVAESASKTATVQKPSVHESFLADAAKLMDTKRRNRSSGATKSGKLRSKDPKQDAQRQPEEVEDADAGSYSAWKRPKRCSRKPSAAWLAGSSPLSAEEEESGEPNAEELVRPNGHADHQEATERSMEDLDLSGPETPPSESVKARGLWQSAEIPSAEDLTLSPSASVSIEEELHNRTSRSRADAGALTPPKALTSISTAAADADSPRDAGQAASNQEAGQAAMDRALEAMQAGDHEKAFRLFCTAASLSSSADPRLKQLMEFCELYMRQQKKEEEGPARDQPDEVATEVPSPWAEAPVDDGKATPAGASGLDDSLRSSDDNQFQFRAGEGAKGQEPEAASPGKSKDAAKRAAAQRGGDAPSQQGRRQKKQSQSKQNNKGPKQATKQQQQQQQQPQQREARAEEEEPRAERSPAVGSQEWADEHKKAMEGKDALEAAVIWILVLAATALYSTFQYVRHPTVLIYNRAPVFMLDVVAFFRWHRLHRFLLARKQRSLGASLALGAVSSVLALVAAYWLFHVGLLLLYFSWATLELSLEATVCILSAAVTAAVGLLDLAFWRPGFWSSAALAVCMRYGSLLFGSGQGIFYVSCFWGWPLLSYYMGGGLLGILTLPYCFFASVWHVSHLHLVLGFSLLARVFSWLGWGYFRATSLVIGALYLFLVAVPETEEKQGKKSTLRSYDVPEGVDGDVARVLKADDLYEVLMVPRNADAETLRKAKRVMSLATHPDKLSQAVGSNEAFARVTEAHEVLSDPGRREAYDKELSVKAYLEEMQWQDRQGGSGDGDSLEGITFMCPACGLEHTGTFVDRPVERARYCSECKKFHPAKEGDGWHESSFGLLGRKVRMFVCLNGRVLDMTQWADCALKLSKLGAQVPVNTHKASYSFGADLGGDDPSPRGSGGGSTKKNAKKGRRR